MLSISYAIALWLISDVEQNYIKLGYVNSSRPHVCIYN